MTKEQLQLIEEFLDAKIEKAIADSFGRDSCFESVKVWDVREKIEKEFVK